MAYRSDEYYTGVFMGRKSLNEYVRVESLEFPVGAFKDFLRAEGMPMPDFWKAEQNGAGSPIKPAPAACPVTAAPSLPALRGPASNSLRLSRSALPRVTC